MSDPLPAVLSAVIGLVVGMLAALVWKARREQELRIETEVLRARVRSDETVIAEREESLIRAPRAASGRVRRSRTRQLEEQQRNVPAACARADDAADPGCIGRAQERETAIEALVKPIRDALAKTETQIQTIERERIDAFATIKTQMEVLAGGQASLSRETRNLVTRCGGRTCAGNGAKSP